MERSAADRWLSWLILPASAALVLSALTLSRHAYTGVTVTGDRVATVRGRPARASSRACGRATRSAMPRNADGPRRWIPIRCAASSPACPSCSTACAPAEHRAGLAGARSAAGDPRGASTRSSSRSHRDSSCSAAGCGASAATGSRAPSWSCAWRSPACSHPSRASDSRAWQQAYDLAYTAAQLFAAVVFAHFFALFPEPAGRTRNRLWVRAGYGAASRDLAGDAW